MLYISVVSFRYQSLVNETYAALATSRCGWRHHRDDAGCHGDRWRRSWRHHGPLSHTDSSHSRQALTVSQ